MYKNQVILEGFLGKNPEVRFMPSGDKIANVTLATKEIWTDKHGKPASSTEWHALVFYGTRADRAGQYQKGDNIHIEGKLQTRKYTNAEGQAKTVREIIVMRTHRIDRMNDEPEELEGAPDHHEPAATPATKANTDHWPEL